MRKERAVCLAADMLIAMLRLGACCVSLAQFAGAKRTFTRHTGGPKSMLPLTLLTNNEVVGDPKKSRLIVDLDSSCLAYWPPHAALVETDCPLRSPLSPH